MLSSSLPAALSGVTGFAPHRQSDAIAVKVTVPTVDRGPQTTVVDLHTGRTLSRIPGGEREPSATGMRGVGALLDVRI